MKKRCMIQPLSILLFGLFVFFSCSSQPGDKTGPSKNLTATETWLFTQTNTDPSSSISSGIMILNAYDDNSIALGNSMTNNNTVIPLIGTPVTTNGSHLYLNAKGTAIYLGPPSSTSSYIFIISGTFGSGGTAGGVFTNIFANWAKLYYGTFGAARISGSGVLP